MLRDQALPQMPLIQQCFCFFFFKSVPLQLLNKPNFPSLVPKDDAGLRLRWEKFEMKVWVLQKPMNS